jgi:general stress protein 26
MINPAVRSENIKKLRELIKDIPIAMLTSIDKDGKTVRTRPAATQKIPFEGELWFFTRMDAPSVTDTGEPTSVNVIYTNTPKALYISVSGMATIMRDLNMMEELWQPRLKAWFPYGLDDPQLSLIKVEVTQAEYWDGPDNPVQELVGFVRSFAQGERFDPGKNETLDLT